jgi:hypothetical protein
MVPGFANPALTAYLQAMPKHIELPPRVGVAFEYQLIDAPL